MTISGPTSSSSVGSPFLGMRYRVDALLGRGGMGTVYRAQHLGLRIPVALKVLDAAMAGPDLDARFEREARTAARLHHPGCIRVLDYGKTVDKKRYIAMDYLEGPTLAALLAERGALSTAEAVRITGELLKALAHAHREGVLHRDIKPENIMTTRRDGSARWILIDFGLARLIDDDPLTVVGSCYGSPSYLAPERLLGRPYDARADLYAVGILLYEMLAGRRPFVGRNIKELALAQIKSPPPALRSARPDLHPDLAAVVHRALAKDPRQRYADAESMLSALCQAPVDLSAPESAPAFCDPGESTTIIAQLDDDRPPLHRRAWSWMRYGSWRWSHQLSATSK